MPLKALQRHISVTLRYAPFLAGICALTVGFSDLKIEIEDILPSKTTYIVKLVKQAKGGYCNYIT